MECVKYFLYIEIKVYGDINTERGGEGGERGGRGGGRGRLVVIHLHQTFPY